jgi:hypothetical protein
VYHNDRAYWGFAANVQFMTVALNYALVNRRVFMAQESDHWNYGGRDCRHGWHCYFQPLSNCSERDVWEPHVTPLNAAWEGSDEYQPYVSDDIRVTPEHWWDNIIRRDYRGYNYQANTSEARVVAYANVDGPWQEEILGEYCRKGGYCREWIPEEFRQRGLLWWRAQVCNMPLFAYSRSLSHKRGRPVVVMRGMS